MAITPSSSAAPPPSSQHSVLVVDDDRSITSLYARLFTRDGYAVSVAHDAASAFAALTAAAPDVVVLDISLPDHDGVEICRRLKRESATRLTPIVLVTGRAERESRLEGLAAGADEFLTKPFDSEELLVRVRSLARLKRYTDDLDSAASIIETLAVMIETRDDREQGHCHRMANYATALGRRLGFGSDDLQALYRGGFLHDIGMLAIPDHVLRKTGPLEPEEYELIKSHTVIGEDLCGNLRSLQSVRPIVRHHHERFDGSGYPDGLVGDQIPLIAQIMGLVDAFDAITTARPYHAPQTVAEATDLLSDQARRGWRRADLVQEFLVVVKDTRVD